MRKKYPTRKNPTTDIELLDQCNKSLYYDPENGFFQWKESAKGRFIGQEAGCLTKAGYITINLCGYLYYAHCLAFLMEYKYLPEWPGQVDHIDRDRSHNWISNLRHSTSIQNGHNSGPRGIRKYKGVFINVNTWIVKTIGAPKIYQGSFKCEHYAARVWNTAARMYQGYEFCYTNDVESCGCLECR